MGICPDPRIWPLVLILMPHAKGDTAHAMIEQPSTTPVTALKHRVFSGCSQHVSLHFVGARASTSVTRQFRSGLIRLLNASVLKPLHWGRVLPSVFARRLRWIKKGFSFCLGKARLAPGSRRVGDPGSVRVVS